MYNSKKLILLILSSLIMATCKSQDQLPSKDLSKSFLSFYFERFLNTQKINLYKKALTKRNLENVMRSNKTTFEWTKDFFKKEANIPPNTLLHDIDSIFSQELEFKHLKNQFSKDFTYDRTLIFNVDIALTNRKSNSLQISKPLFTLDNGYVLIFLKDNYETSNGSITLRIFENRANSWKLCGVYTF